MLVRMGMFWSVIQMCIVLIATYDRASTPLLMSDRTLCGLPRAILASSLAPHTKLRMWGVMASVLIRRSVNWARIFAMSKQLPGSETGSAYSLGVEVAKLL